MIRSMKTATILCCAALLSTGPAQAETFDRGQALYENHCQTCHEEKVHMRYSRRVTTMDDLRQQVSSWSYHAGLGWSAEEVTDVVDYLDREFYHFAEPADKDTR